MVAPLVPIGQRLVGEGQPCYIVAEAGVNHNGSLVMARQLIDVAVAAGADAVKFQTFNPDTAVTKSAAKASYAKTGAGDQETFYEMLCRLALSHDDFRQLNDHARERGIVFFSKGYKDDTDFLVGLDVPMLKIDSSQITWYSHIRKVAEQKLPVILSTGTATLGEVEKALEITYEAGNHDVIVLHCTTAYPAPIDQINLRAMVTLRNAFGVNVGLSDHSLGIEAALGAVALGAVMIEKHFTLDCALPGPDHRASLEPDGLASLVQGVRRVEAALGGPIKGPRPVERENMLLVRRGLVAECYINSGARFDSSNVSFKRPSGGLGEEFMDVVLGRIATRDIGEGQPITWDVVGGFSDG